MNPINLTEDNLSEQPAIEWFREMGYETAFGPDISPGGIHPERESFEQVVLTDRLRKALSLLNPHLPVDALEDALHQLIHIGSSNLIENNRHFHSLVCNGIKIEVVNNEGDRMGDYAQVFDFDNHENNDFLVVNQFSVVSGENKRRPDIVIFINGLPIAVLELKNPGSELGTVKTGYRQLQKYKLQVPELFHYNEVLITSDLLSARHGTLTGGWEFFFPWKTVVGEEMPPKDSPELEVMIHGMFEKSRLLDLIKNFIVFESDGGGFIKKMAIYHQYHAVNVAVEETVRASSLGGDQKVGIVWHSQGAGKSLSMVFYAAKIMQHTVLGNPTLLVLTDRNDLDNQIYENFCKAPEFIPYPKQAESIEDLKRKLSIPAGGVIFSTIQKFGTKKGYKYPLLSERHNIVVIADEAHRSQYRELAGNVRDGLPNASFIGFTATPIELDDRSTRVVFGDYISIYPINQAVEDGATVPIYYEGRLAKLHQTNEFIDVEFEEITEREEIEVKEKLKSKWARLESIVGADERLTEIAHDIVEHFSQREIEGKGIVVCMSRRIAVHMWELITGIPGAPETAVVISGGADDPRNFKPHLRSKRQMEKIKERFKDPNDSLKLVIVRDMWLTGFDAPVLHTMYVDKPMRDHNLIQAIARVNRVFRDKPGGLIVDYIGIADDLKKSLRIYSDSVRQDAMIPLDQAITFMREKYDIVCAYLHGIDYLNWQRMGSTELAYLLQRAQNAITVNDETKDGFLRACTELMRAHAIVSPHKEANDIRRDIAFFQTVQRSIRKYTPSARDAEEETETAIKQLISESVASKGVVDIFSEIGKERLEVSIMSDEFLDDLQKMEYRNLAIEVLRKLLNDEIKTKLRKNVFLYRSFKEMLEVTITRYHNNVIQSAEVIQKLIEMAKEIRAVPRRGETLGLSDEEMAFYDAVAKGREYIVQSEQMKEIARELTATIKANLSIDWADQENVKAKIRAAVRRLLRRKGFKPEESNVIILNVMEQAESLYEEWPEAI